MRFLPPRLVAKWLGTKEEMGALAIMMQTKGVDSALERALANNNKHTQKFIQSFEIGGQLKENLRNDLQQQLYLFVNQRFFHRMKPQIPSSVQLNLFEWEKETPAS